MARSLAERCRELDGVIWVRTNHLCGSVVLGYTISATSAQALADAMRDLLTPPDRGDRLPAKRFPEPDISHPLRPALVRFAGTSLVAGGIMVQGWISGAALATGVFSPLGILAAIAALPLVLKGLRRLRKRRFTLETFLGGAVMAAIAAGEAVAALEILWITSGADLLTAWVTERSRRAIRDILEVTGRNTYIRVHGIEVEVPVEEVAVGDVVAVHAGEKIPVDGVIVDGGALVDESPINGRAEFASRITDDHVFAGTFVRQGVIGIRAERVGDDTYLSRILTLVEDSLAHRAPVEGAADELARKLVRLGFAATAGTFLVTGSFWRTFSVMLVMACPCATILAASTAVAIAIGAAAKRHILVKGGRYLEEVGQMTVACFDKTGTLTTNRPELREIHHAMGITDEELLQLAYSAEKHNQHPIALAIRAEAERQGLTVIPHEICEYIPGCGMRAVIRGEELLVGNARLMGHFNVDRMGIARQVVRKSRHFEDRGLTVVFVAREGRLVGILGFANQTRPEAVAVVDYLRNNGMSDILLITGDENRAAACLVDDIGFAGCYASLTPDEKADLVKRFRGSGGRILMVGDGINDALALAEADVGVAMGAGGSEVAIEAADIALVTDDLEGLVYVHSLSRRTMSIIRQNFLLATGSNVAGIVLGALGWLSPVMAGLIHVVHTVGILANSTRLMFHETPPPETPRRGRGFRRPV